MKTFTSVVCFLVCAAMASAQITWTSPTRFGTGNLRSAATSGGSSVICGDGQLLYSSGGEPFKKAQTSMRDFVMNDVALVWGNIFIAVGEGGVILRSTDGGASWRQVADFASTLNSCLSIVGNGSVLAAGRNGLIARSADAGQTWTAAASFTGEDLYSMSGTGLSVIAVGAGGTIARSTDGGYSWNAWERAVDDDLHASALLSQKYGFVGGVGGAIYYTSDGGETWRSVFADDDFIFQKIRFLNSQLGYAVGAGNRIARTSNGGVSWTVSDVVAAASINDVFGDANNIIMIGDFGLIMNSSDGGSNWAASMPIVQERLFCARFDSEQTIWAVGGRGAILNNSGGEWRTIASPTENDITALYVGNPIIIGDAKGIIYYSNTSGATWQKVDSNGLPIGCAARFANGAFAAVGAGGVIRRSEDGVVWESAATSVSSVLTSVSAVDAAIAVAVGDSGVILRTTDAGFSWTATYQANYALTSIAFVNSQNGFAVGARGIILRTTDAGMTWNRVISPDTTQNWVSVAFDRTTQGGVLVSLEGDVYATFDRGATWRRTAATGALCLNSDFKNNLAVVCGGGGGVFTLPGIVSAEEPNLITTLDVKLYPLPAEDAAELSLTSSIVQNAVISIISSNGEVIYSTHVEASPGKTAFRLHCGSFASGAYLCRVRSSIGSASLPLIIIR